MADMVKTPRAERTRLDGQGRLVIPARIRAAAGWTPGSTLAVRVSHGRVIVEALDSIERKMWRAAGRGPRGDATAELLADRRRESL
ncbi:MAG: AbrB/MazE/SpoVT family DNA-binding domain-containing protein [Chloroflexota bacterium]